MLNGRISQKSWKVFVLIKYIFISFMFMNQSFAGMGDTNEDQLKNIFPLVDNTFKEIKLLTLPSPPLCFVSIPQDISCPLMIQDSIDDNFYGGITGVIKFVVGDGLLATPDKICSTNNVTSSQVLLKKIQESQLPSSEIKNVLNKAKGCFEYVDKKSGLSEAQKEKTKTSAVLEMIYKPMQVQGGIKNMLEAKTQLNLFLNDGNSNDCKSFLNAETREFCEKTNNCQNPKHAEIFASKASQLFHALKAIQSINTQIKKLRQAKIDDVDLGKLELAVEGIKHLYPMLKSSGLSDAYKKTFFSDRPITQDEVEKGLKQEFINTRKKISQNLTELRYAEACIKNDNKCNLTPLLNEVAPYSNIKFELPGAAMYECLEDQKQNSAETNKIINTALFSTALNLTPLGIVQASKTLYQIGALIKSAETIEALGKTATYGALLGDAMKTGHEAYKIFDACADKLEYFSNNQSTTPSCDIQNKKADLQLDLNACQEQVLNTIISGAFSTLGVKLNKLNEGKQPHIRLNASELNEEKNMLINFGDYLSSLSDPKERAIAIKEISKRLELLNKTKEYTKDEIQAAIKVYLKKCK
jgi:hypothetical protein